MNAMQIDNTIIAQDLSQIGQRVLNKDYFRSANILISGANGFIASYLICSLLSMNTQYDLGLCVYGLARSGDRMRQRFGTLLDRDDFRMVIQDVSQPMADDIPADIIIHAASQTAPRQFQTDPVGTALGNIIGTQNLLSHAVHCKAKAFLLLSTREIYGKAIADFVTEDDYGGLDCTQVRSCYPEAKRMSETLCAAYRAQHGLNAKIARIAHCYGPGMQLRDGRVVSDFLGNVVDGQDIVMNSDGSGTLSLTYIADVVSGLLSVLCDYPQFVYNVSNDAETLSVKELAQLLCDISPGHRSELVMKVIPKEAGSGYLTYKVGFLNSDKARAAGWKALVPLRAGLSKTIRYFQANGTAR